MKYFWPPRTQNWLTGATAALGALASNERVQAASWSGFSALPGPPAMDRSRFGFSFDGVLGTSLDVRLDALSARDAREGERQMLAEIDRLENILSTYRAESEINRVKMGGPVESRELTEVLAAYDLWSARSGGALSSNLAEVISLWKSTAKTGQWPSPAALAKARDQPRALNIDALGKGYIVDRAVAVARQFASAGLINLGGDLRVWGSRAWMVGIADPGNPADNSGPLLEFPLRDAAVATSAGYARGFEINGQRFSHLIDPRTLSPISPQTSATVVARDCLTANALSTSASVLGAESGGAFARAYGMDHLIIEAKAADEVGGGSTSPSLTRKSEAIGSTESVASGVLWPEEFQATITIALKSLEGFRARRPYVAVWVEGPGGKLVRTITIWGRQERYLPDLSKWWSASDGDWATARAVSRATRQPGVYTLAWDGRDDRGNQVPLGDYRIWIEINREHGRHVSESAVLTCGLNPESAKIRATPESEVIPVEYGPKHK